MRTLLLATACLGGILLSACSSDPDVTVSKGQELNDLQKAYQNRAITADEYKDQKKEVLDK